MAGPPKKIMIIRHGEKPVKNVAQGVEENGTCDSKSLIVIGWQRAGALNAFFAPAKGAPPKKDIANPDYIYAANPNAESQRPCETVTPLAAWLGYKRGSARFNAQYDIGGGEPQLVKAVLALDGTVLICWEHDNIKQPPQPGKGPCIVDEINRAVPITNYNQMPKKWPDVFDLVWVFDLDSSGKKYAWNQVQQELMAGDKTE
jgi:hypothetical protein